MEETHYEEFDVLLEPSGAGGYTARVLDSPTGPTKRIPFVPPGTPEGLKLLVLTLRAVHGVRALEAEAVPDAKKYGTTLFDAIFHDEALSALRGSLHVAAVNRHGLRLRLRFNDTPALVNIPWELMYDKEAHRFPCQLGKYPVVRFVEIAEPLSPLAVTGPVRMIVVISSPSDYQQLNVEAEWSKLQGILEPLVKSGRLQVDRLPTASLDVLRRAVLSDYHVFHFIGHGGVDKATGDGILIFTGPDGQGRRVTGHDLGVMLSNSPIRLAVLNSCEGARISEVDPYAGTAVSLVQQGIPAVVAMQFEITDEAAIAFSSTLYEGITMGRPVDLAVTLARQAILAVRPTEWATPVLYLRAGDGKIFDLADQVIEAPPPPPVPTPVAVPQPTPTPAPATQPVPGPEAVGAAEARPLPPAPPPLPPANLAGHATRREVQLSWRQPRVEEVPVDHWEVLRDGTVVAETRSKRWAETPGRGKFVYAVTAVGRDSRRSVPSDEIVLGPHGRRTWPWVLLVLAVVAALVVWRFWPQPSPPPQVLLPPVNVTGTATPETGAGEYQVNLTWEPASGSVPVSLWEVRRDGVQVMTVKQQSAKDRRLKAGRYSYTVVAIDAAGRRSDPSRPKVVVISPTSPTTTPSPSEETPEANVSIKLDTTFAGAGSGELVVRFKTDNLGPADIGSEVVKVRATGSGRILAAVFRSAGGGESPCGQARAGFTCTIGTHAILGLATVDVTVLQDAAFEVIATVESELKDPNRGNNTASYPVQVPTTTRPPPP